MWIKIIIKILAENRSISNQFNCEHGLSLYIKTKQHRFLFDLGASSLFAQNAQKMNIDLAGIDLVVISHGHYDHGGGLNTFLKINSKANIYIRKQAFNKHYSISAGREKKYTGLDNELLPYDRYIFTKERFVIDEQLELFSNVKGNRFNPSGNQNLYMEQGGSLVQDDFAHEQNLIIKKDNQVVLIAGCAHRGIVNIIEHLNSFKYGELTHVIGGFHLYNRSTERNEDPEIVHQIGQYLKNTGARCFTGHCTGIEPYKQLKKIMGEKINYVPTGSEFCI